MILVALGANLPGPHGGPLETLAAAKTAMAERDLPILKASRTWLTAPVPVSDQPWYHNEVVQVDTNLTPLALLETLHDIEKEFGRARSERNAARVLDLDLLAYHDEIVDRPELIVPHPRLHSRAFVLLPLQEITPDWIHPVTGVSLAVLIAALPPGQEAKAI
ncbi:MAG TPA: 2-amino-4-hydroxy-6-hydroxymethyldihydropteridine diphosphokinase [Alphaproteobacteria bacterium]